MHADIVYFFKEHLEHCVADFLSRDISSVSAANRIATLKTRSYDEEDFKKKLFFDSMKEKELIHASLQYYAERLKSGMEWGHSCLHDMIFLFQFVQGKSAAIYQKNKSLYPATAGFDKLYNIYNHYQIKKDIMDQLEVLVFGNSDMTKLISSKFGSNSFAENLDFIDNMLFNNACINCMEKYCDVHNYPKIDELNYMSFNTGPSVINGTLYGSPSNIKTKQPSKFMLTFIENKLDYLNK